MLSIKRTSLLILIANFIISLLHALFLPAIGLLLFKKYSLNAMEIGLFFVALAISSIFASQAVAKLSDRGFSRVTLIRIGLFGGFGSCLIFTISTRLSIDASAGIIFFSLTFMSLSQLVALTRDFSDFVMDSDASIKFNIAARAAGALAWVLGPAIGFFIFEVHGHTVLLNSLSLGYLSFAIIVTLFPSTPGFQRHNKIKDSGDIKLSEIVTFRVALSLIVFSMIFSCNQSYIISLPLFLHKSFSLSERYAGILLGSSAGIEIGVMLLTSFLLKRISIFVLLTVSLVSAVILYSGFWLSSSYSSLLMLQVFNSICTGIAISLGAIWFQNMLPNYTGIASTLFTNCISAGVIFGAIIVGATNYLEGYRDVYLINSILMFGSLGIFCVFCREKKVLKDDTLIQRTPEPLRQNVGIRSESTSLG